MEELPLGVNQFHYQAERQNASLYVRTVGYEKPAQAYHWGPGQRSYYLLHQVAQGDGRCTLNGIIYPVHAGDVFVSLPNTELMVESDGQSQWEYYWVGFAGSEVELLLKRMGYSSNAPVLHVGWNDTYRELFRAIYHDTGSRFAQSTAMTGHLYLLFSQLLEALGENDVESSDDQFQRILRYIQTHEIDHLSQEEICQSIGISRSWMYRLFIQQIGVSPSKYLTECKVKLSCVYLTNTQMSIAEIAWKVGYDDPLYYSRVFHHVIGSSPSAYRKLQQRSFGLK